mgnify:CR=1 FL=1
MTRLLSIVFLIVAVLGLPARAETGEDRIPEILVEADSVVCRSFLGFGAEWDPYYRQKSGDVPRVSDEDWEKITERIRYMKPPILRMMMLLRWCYDGENYRWDKLAMKRLYRHLDVCQEQGVDVILTEWVIRGWGSVPGITNVADPAYAEAIGTYLDHLVNEKGYSCIKYLILINHPNHSSAGWPSWRQGARNVAEQLRSRGLDDEIILLGSDAGGRGHLPWHTRAVDQLGDTLGGYSIHWYAPDSQVRPGELESFFAERWNYAWRNDPRGRNKPMLVTEAGMRDGAVPPASNRNIHTYRYGLFMADYAVQAARAGSSSVLAWMLDDNSHQNFRWGLWSDSSKGLKLRPWFYTWSLLTRYFPQGCTVYSPEQPGEALRVLAAKTGARDDWTFCLVNRAEEPAKVRLRVPGGGSTTLRRYVYSRDKAPEDSRGFPVPVAEREANLGEGLEVECPGRGVVFLTSCPR